MDTSYISNAKWTRMDTIWCPFVSNDGPARIQISGRLAAMASRGHAAGESGEGRRNLVRGSFVVFVGCGIMRSTGFQPCKGGDVACIRGPSGAFLIISYYTYA